jgi:peptidoglycan/LPS O-acetylase OafA/YrhL
MTTTAPTASGAALAPGETTSRRRDVQGLRAVAVLLVVAFHAELPVPGGFTGVDVFFVISGFVITAMLMREWAAHGRLRFGTFYLRRFLRLTPALALTVSAVAIASFLLQNPYGAQQTAARTGLGAMLLSANYVLAAATGDYFAQSATSNPLLNTWSLSVEEQFYLVFPALLLLGWLGARRMYARSGRTAAWVPVTVVATVAAGSFALSLAWSYGSGLTSALTDLFGGAPTFAFYSSITRAWEFAVGALLALTLARLPVPSRLVRDLGGAVGAGLIVVAALVLHQGAGFPGWSATIPVVGALLLLWAGSYGTTGVSGLLARRPFVLVGDVSYSWYLWHWPVIVFAALLWPNEPVVLVTAAVGSLLPAVVSYLAVEQPLRRLRPRSVARTAALVAVTVGVPVALCLALLAGANNGWGMLASTPTAEPSVAAPLVPASTAPTTPTAPGSAAASAATGASVAPTPAPTASTPDQEDEVASGEGGSLRSQHAAVKAGCVNTDLDPVHCRFGVPDARGTVLLAGDSQAYAVADGVIAAVQRLGYDVIVTSHTGCPLLARVSSGSHNYPCRSWQQSIVDYATTERPDAVIIANRSAGYVHPEWDYRTAARDDGSAATSVAEAADLWRKGLTPVVRDITGAGVPVMFVAAVPEMTGYEVRTSVLGVGDPFEVSRSQSEADRKPALDVETSLAERFPGVSVFDPNPSLCTSTTCTADGPDGPIYQDETHLSLAGSLKLTDRLAEALSAVLAPPTTASPTSPTP